jgi:hypothetical protein
MSDDGETLRQAIYKLSARLIELDKERKSLIDEIESLSAKLKHVETESATPPIKNVLHPNKKITLFRSLFKGRQDVYPKLWTNKKGMSGYSPVCKNEWVKGICRKPKIKCRECDNRIYLPVTDEVITKHLKGNITIGILCLKMKRVISSH